MILIPLLAAAVVASPISADRIRTDVRTLSSDAFGGRGPGEAGEAKTIAYLAAQFAAAGLQPAGDGGGWFQDVPLMRLDRLPGATLTLDSAALALGRDAALSLRNAGATSVADAPLVFAGFGIVDAKTGYDAYAGVPMTGKVAVILANDPDFEAGRDLGFEGRRMVYAGRIGVKIEAAAHAGAVGALIIHEDAAASYPFSQIGSGDALPAMALAPLAPSTIKFTGWLQGDVATALLKRHGLTLEALKERARAPGFRAFSLDGSRVSVAGAVRTTPVVSHNVLAQLPGASRATETVLYGAHWDANGMNGPVGGDGIRNGAVDNATGTAEVLEIARAFADGPRPARTVVFAAWTAEEKGLLGSDYYAGHPRFPLATTALMINLDPHVVLPAARDIELIGGGRVSAETDLRRVAGMLGLRLDDEPATEAGWYFRSDQFSFAKRGVPAITFRAGRDLVAGGFTAGAALVADYNAHRYHQPSDEFVPAWTFAGTVQEATVAFMLGSEIANGGPWPDWLPGNEYLPMRAATGAERMPTSTAAAR